MTDPQRLNITAGAASIAVAAVLVGLKFWALAATGSLSVAASLVDSVVDLLVSSAGLVGILYAARPPDEDHSFGHSSVEDLVALGQATLVSASALAIGWSAVSRLVAPAPLAAEAEGIVVMVSAALLTAGLVLWQGAVARRTGSRIVAADRLHYLSDLLPTLGAIAALYVAGTLGVVWFDPAVALVACALLLRGAWSIGAAAWHALMDRRADPALLDRIEALVARDPRVAGFHGLRTRTAGTRVFIQLHLEIDGRLSLAEAHAIGADLRRTLLAAIPDADVIIHKDPV